MLGDQSVALGAQDLQRDLLPIEKCSGLSYEVRSTQSEGSIPWCAIGAQTWQEVGWRGGSDVEESHRHSRESCGLYSVVGVLREDTMCWTIRINHQVHQQWQATGRRMQAGTCLSPPGQPSFTKSALAKLSLQLVIHIKQSPAPIKLPHFRLSINPITVSLG